MASRWPWCIMPFSTFVSTTLISLTYPTDLAVISLPSFPTHANSTTACSIDQRNKWLVHLWDGNSCEASTVNLLCLEKLKVKNNSLASISTTSPWQQHLTIFMTLNPQKTPKTSNKQIPKFKEKSKEIAKEKTTDTPCPPAPSPQLPL